MKKDVKGTNGAALPRAPVKTDWWTGRQEARAEDVLQLEHVRRHIESIRHIGQDRALKKGQG